MNEADHTPLPWSIRPNKFDDWGFIRGSDGSMACCARGDQGRKTFDDHRTDNTDPYQANADLIVRSVNALPDLIKVLKAYEQWEAELIMENKCWEGRDLPQLTGELWDRLIEIQHMRNAALASEK